jgi:transposase InsO family protein
LVGAPQKRGFVAFARERAVSQRRACQLAGLWRSVARYERKPTPQTDEAELVERLKAIAHKKRRRGYRLAHQELQRDGLQVNHKRVHRLWKRVGLCVSPRRGRKRIRSVRPAPRDVVATRPNAVWCLDFLEDRTMSGAKLRLLCVSDEFTRESLAIEVGRSFKSERVCSTLADLMAARGVPGALRMDNGPEFVALTLRGLCQRRDIDASYIDPGKPWQNGFAESFHARLRDEFLDGEAFLSTLDAQVRLSVWRRYYNEERLHSSLGYLTPGEFAGRWSAESPKGQKPLETKEPIGPTCGG